MALRSAEAEDFIGQRRSSFDLGILARLPRWGRCQLGTNG
jgi:hypothetical protein